MYLAAQDPKMLIRTWTDIMERFCNRANDKMRMADCNTVVMCNSSTPRSTSPHWIGCEVKA
jgi:hypothetical protein